MLMEPWELIVRGSTDIHLVADPLVSRALRFMVEHGEDPASGSRT